MLPYYLGPIHWYNALLILFPYAILSQVTAVGHAAMLAAIQRYVPQLVCNKTSTLAKKILRCEIIDP